MKDYPHICQNEECQEEYPVEILGFDPGEDPVLGRAWEDCSPGSPAEVEYKLPNCPKCGAAQEDSRALEKDILRWVMDQANDSLYD